MLTSVHHMFAIPGCLLLVLAAANLMRYRRWPRVTATILQRETLPGEIIDDKVKIVYDISGLRYISEVQQTFGAVPQSARANEDIEISDDPLNPGRCMAYNPAANFFTIAIAVVMISM